MKKTLAALAATMAMGASVYADYVWTGGDISSESWADESNWNHDDSKWNGSAAGPNTTGSNMWDPITISGKSGKLDKLDGWDLSLSLEDCNLVIDELSTLKTDAACTISIDEKSTLTINNFASYNHDGGSGTNFDVKGTLNITVTQNWPQAGTAPTVDLGEYGSINVSGDGILSVGTLSLTSTAVNQTVTSAEEKGTMYTLVEKDLGRMSIDNLTVDGKELMNYTEYGLTLTPCFMDAGSFVLTQNADGHNILHYVVAGTPTVLTKPDPTPGTNPGTGEGTGEGSGTGSSSVPEPATATLSLLALAGLATRRRRKN